MTPQEHKEQQKARIAGSYKNPYKEANPLVGEISPNPVQKLDLGPIINNQAELKKGIANSFKDSEEETWIKKGEE